MASRLFPDQVWSPSHVGYLLDSFHVVGLTRQIVVAVRIPRKF